MPYPDSGSFVRPRTGNCREKVGDLPSQGASYVEPVYPDERHHHLAGISAFQYKVHAPIKEFMS